MEEYLQALAEGEKEREPFRRHLRELNKEFRNYLTARYSKRTADRHSSIVWLFIEFLTGYTDVQSIEEITRGMVNTHFQRWYRRKVLVSSTPDDLRVALKKFFQFLEAEKGISNPRVLRALK